MWLLCAWPVYFADRMIARHSVYRLLADAGAATADGPQRTPGNGQVWTPSCGPHLHRRAAELAEGQTRLEHPYETLQHPHNTHHRFVGAGLGTGSRPSPPRR
ncbi:hypothetical protein [Streptomyces sp. TRM68367]|uniref:hypothetical protein n=1 Tax=Streptomyces sp. TRM68367 TaxID=2758415 RepID=UPI00165BB99F|nr:hypothetical protein [Streptomyces sp. TRM68367]MBC9731314.1 hypothetical protein [Streptomyces sp. TRM68367]